MMVTIIGNGMGDYNFNNLDINFCKYDKIICDKNFIEKGNNVLKVGYRDALDYIENNYNKEEILYVVSGSPYFYSAGILIAKKLPKDQYKIINAPSSLEYMQEKMLIQSNQIEHISLHGRPSFDLEKFLHNTYTFLLCDKFTISKLQNAIKYLDNTDVEITIGYKLGYEDELIELIDIYDQNILNKFDLSKPYVLVIKRNYTLNNTIDNDDEFNTQRGMITKKFKRHLSLQNLDLKPNQLLWDIGAGSGACGIESFKRYKVKTVLFENQEQRCEFIEQNLSKHHVLDTVLLKGDAQNLFEQLEQNPQRIFVGGGGQKVIAKLPYLYERLDDDGIILINAITLKHLSLMINTLNEAQIEFETHSISLTTYKGKLDLVEPERQLFQIKIYKKGQ
jgi:precorrin-6Y C5,15-methyltransferase (decarboxylating)